MNTYWIEVVCSLAEALPLDVDATFETAVVFRTADVVPFVVLRAVEVVAWTETVDELAGPEVEIFEVDAFVTLLAVTEITKIPVGKICE